MPPRLNVWSACRNLAIRSARPAATNQLPQWQQLSQPSCIVAAARRALTDDATTRIPDQNNLPPQNPADMMPSGQFSLNQPEVQAPIEEDEALKALENARALEKLNMIAYGLQPYDVEEEGHKYGTPELPLEDGTHLKHRYNPVIALFTRLMMRDGKLGKAQRHMAMILNYIRTQPAPKLNPAKPLLPGTPPASHLPLDPVNYITIAIDSVAPLVRVRGFSGLGGGGRALDVPFPMEQRQRRRVAMQWILEAALKKKSKGSGRTMYAHKVAEEIVAVMEGRSGVWDKRMQIHKLGTASRANLSHRDIKKYLERRK